MARGTGSASAAQHYWQGGSGSSQGHSEIHVHVEDGGDGQLSVIISDADQEPGSCSSLCCDRRAGTAELVSTSNCHLALLLDPHMAGASAAATAAGSANACSAGRCGCSDASTRRTSSPEKPLRLSSSMLSLTQLAQQQQQQQQAGEAVAARGCSAAGRDHVAAGQPAGPPQPGSGLLLHAKRNSGAQLQTVSYQQQPAVLSSSSQQQGLKAAFLPGRQDRQTTPAVVVPLSSAALAARTSQAALSAVQPGSRAAWTAAAVDNCASSCCDGQSDLSAMANPLIYADRLRQQMDKHLGQAAAAAGEAADGSCVGVEQVSPNAAVLQLDEYLSSHQPLQQKAGL